MPVESVTYISDLNAAWPLGTGEPKSLGDDHMRNIKFALLNTFPHVAGVVQASHAQLNRLAELGALSVLGNATNGAAAPAAITAGANHDVLRRSGNTIGFGKLNDTALSANVALKNGANVYSNYQSIERGAATMLRMRQTNSSTPADQGAWAWEIEPTTGALRLRAQTDTYAGGSIPITLTRSGTATESLELSATTIAFNGIPLTDLARRSSINQFTYAGSGPATAAIEVRSVLPAIALYETDAPANNRYWDFRCVGGQLQGAVVDDANSVGASWLEVTRAGANIEAVNFPTGELRYGGVEVGYRGIPLGTFTEHGKVIAATGGGTLNTGLKPGHTFALYNNSGSAITLSQGIGLTLRLAGTTSVGNRTVAPRGWATVWALSSTEYIVLGPGVS